MRKIRLEKRAGNLVIAVEISAEPSEDIIALIKKMLEALKEGE